VYWLTVNFPSVDGNRDGYLNSQKGSRSGSRTIARPAGESYQRNTIADASLFRTPLLGTFNALQAAEDCLSTSKYVKNGNTTGEDYR
jgi:hypothetical protein